MIGKEGSYVHMASIICHNLAYVDYFKEFHKVTNRYSKIISKSKTIYNQIMTAAVAAGVAATFGTPYGGFFIFSSFNE